MRKIGQFYPPPLPTVAIFFKVDANNFLNVGEFWFCDEARHNNDDKINIHNALIWVLQDLSKSPRTRYTWLSNHHLHRAYMLHIRGKECGVFVYFNHTSKTRGFMNFGYLRAKFWKKKTEKIQEVHDKREIYSSLHVLLWCKPRGIKCVLSVKHVPKIPVCNTTHTILMKLENYLT